MDIPFILALSVAGDSLGVVSNLIDFITPSNDNNNDYGWLMRALLIGVAIWAVYTLINERK